MKSPTVRVFAYTKQGYKKEILRVDTQQVRLRETNVEGRVGERGMFIRPSDFPEMVEFEILLEE
jgi:hypothetical protein